MAKFYVGNYAATLRGALSGGALSLSVDGQDAELVDGTGGGGIWPWPGDEIEAASASLDDVQAAVDAASDGDWVSIPNGSATWTSGITTTKQIGIVAQNYTPTEAGCDGAANSHSINTGATTRNVTITIDHTGYCFQFTSGNSYHCGVGGIAFNPSGVNHRAVRLFGTGSKVPLVFDCYFPVRTVGPGTSTDQGVTSWLSTGGVMWNCVFDGTAGEYLDWGRSEGATLPIFSGRDWETASTMGAGGDPNGNQNTYVENCTFKNVGQCPDVDGDGRAVFRRCLWDGASGVNHGSSSGDAPARHIECYDNRYTITDDPVNTNRYFWLRGGTGLWTDNLAELVNAGYGNTSMADLEWEGGGTYPQPKQPGYGHNGTANVSDPIYFWNNTGGAAADITPVTPTYIQINRDYYVGTARPSWSKYTYPHPARAGVDGGPP